MKAPVTSDCSLAPKLLFVDWSKILANEKQAVKPLFDLALWNMYDQTIGDLLRTNNAVEGWHRRFQANVGAYHPNFWKFIDILKREQSLNHVNISQARAGHQPEPQRRRYQDSNRRIKNIVQDYHNMDRLQYLRGLAHNISM